MLQMVMMIVNNHVIFKPECVEDHGEEDKLAKEGDDQGGGGDDLGQEEEEHSEGQQDANWKTDLKCWEHYFSYLG